MTTMTTVKQAIAALGLTAILVPILGLAACDRTTMGATHGRAYREAFARQAVDPTAGARARNPRSWQGLDSQEASIVAKTYRTGLAPKESNTGDQAPMLLMAPRGAGRDQGNMPPPSVPER